MNLYRLSLVLLGSAAILAPRTSVAQADPMSGQPSSSQTAQGQQRPGAQASATRSDNGIQDSTGGPGAMAQDMKDKIFLRKAAEGGMAEVKLGQLAADKAGSDDVKSFGQKMVTDHTQLNGALQPFASNLGVTAPKKLNPKDQGEYDKLNALSGDDFDKEYLAFMVKDHHEDLREFRKEAENTTDAALKTTVDKGEVIIRQHTRMVEGLARSKGVATPGRAGMPPPTPTP